MNVTSSGLIKAAGAAAAIAGSIFIAVQVNHPAEARLRHPDDRVGRALLRQGGDVRPRPRGHHRHVPAPAPAGRPRSASSATSSSPLGYLTLLSVEVIAAAVLPSLLDSNPGYVMDVVSAAAGGTPDGDIGGMQVVLNVAGAGYILGGLLFGIALFRTGILPRWASALLAVSTVSTAALAFLPDAFNRPFAVPEGIALIGLGVALWRNPGDVRARTAQPAAAVLSPSVR